jgi:uncharacterized protein YbcI
MNSGEPASIDAAERGLTAVPAASSLQVEIANAVVRVNKELFGRGPTKARVIIHGDVVVCVLAECQTRAERTLIQNGRHEAVAHLRQEMHIVACPKLTRIVEQLTDRRVAACIPGIDLDADEQVLTFRLGGPALETNETDPVRSDEPRGVR